MNVGSRLTVKAYPVTELCYGDENRVTVDGRMTVCKNIADKILAQEPLIKEIDIRIIMPDEHQQHTNTVMDVIPLATKVLGRVGEGITHTLTGVYVRPYPAWMRAGARCAILEPATEYSRRRLPGGGQERRLGAIC